jgi:hypothetical protein
VSQPGRLLIKVPRLFCQRGNKTMIKDEIISQVIKLKRQYIFLLNRDKPKRYEKEIKRVQKQIIKLKRQYALRKIYIKFVRYLLPYLACVATRLHYDRRISLFLDRLIVLSEEDEY